MELHTLQAMKLPQLRAMAKDLSLPTPEGDKRKPDTYAIAIYEHLQVQQQKSKATTGIGIIIILSFVIGLIITVVKVAVWLLDKLLVWMIKLWQQDSRAESYLQVKQLMSPPLVGLELAG